MDNEDRKPEDLDVLAHKKVTDEFDSETIERKKKVTDDPSAEDDDVIAHKKFAEDFDDSEGLEKKKK